MYTMKPHDWERAEQLAVEMVSNSSKRYPLERVIGYIQNQNSNKKEEEKAKELKGWLQAFAEDGFLGARSKSDWLHYRAAQSLVRVLLEMGYTVEGVATMLGWIIRKMQYFEEGNNKIPEITSYQIDFDKNQNPPRIKAAPRKKPKPVRNDIPENREPSKKAEDLFAQLQKKWKK